MNRSEIITLINNNIHENLFTKVRDLILNKKKDRLIHTEDYNTLTGQEKKDYLNNNYKNWYKETEHFYLDLHSIFALKEVVEREKSIELFASENITVVKVDYNYNGEDFTLSYGVRYTDDLKKELDDCILDLSNTKYKHVVDNFNIVKDAEKIPPKPLTNAGLKYNCIYGMSFKPKYTTEIANMLYNAKLITDISTNGYAIDDEIVEEIISLLSKKYSQEQVLEYKREFIDKTTDRSSECIRPIHFTEDYYPKQIEHTPEFQNIEFASSKDKEAAKRIYELIFYITISTQLKNSIYDNSSISIVCGNKKLKQTANKIIENQENWELVSGKIMRNINQNANPDIITSVISLPEIPQGEYLTPINIYPRSYDSRRPKRYGIGRFIIQILEKHRIGFSNEYDRIVDNILSTNACVEKANILYPQSSLMFFMEWLEQYLPSFLDYEYLNELEEKIQSTINNELTIDSILNEITTLINNALTAANINITSTPPSEKKLLLVKKVALKNSISLDNSILNSSAKCDIFLSQYGQFEEEQKIGHCPNCNSFIYKKSFLDNKGNTKYYFACEKFSKQCSFSLWDDYINKYFTNKGLELYSIEDRIDIFKKILSRKRGYLIAGMLNSSNKPYNAKVLLTSYYTEDKKEKWKFDLKFENDKKKIDKAKNKLVIGTKKQSDDIQNTSEEDHLQIKIKQLEQQNRRLMEDGSKDHMTRLYNRKTLEKDMDIFWNHNFGSQITLAFVDGDKFKDVNDTYGHQAGDEVLKFFSNVFMNEIRELKAKAYRYGGEEFVIAFKEDFNTVMSALENIRIFISNNPVIHENNTINLSVSIGVSANSMNLSWDSLLKNADELVYLAKENGRNRIEYKL